MKNWQLATILLPLGAVLLALSVGSVVGFDVSPAHEYSTHQYGVEAVEYDEQHDIVWSIDENTTAISTQFVGYDVQAETVVVTKQFANGNTLTVGDGVVYIAAGNNLWEYNVSRDNTTLLTEMKHSTGAMDYDAERDLVWVGQSSDVVAFDAGNGSVVMRHSKHSDGSIESLSVQGKYIASVLTWEPEVVVYDIENQSVAFEPLPDDIDPEEDNLVSVHLTESTELVIGGGWDTVYLYDVESQTLKTQYSAHAFGAAVVDYHESEDVIVSAGTGNHVAFYDMETESVVRTYEHVDTISAADLDMKNDILWFGDGGREQAGTVTGLQVSQFGPSPVMDDQPPTDPDGDGEYEDVNGDGEFTITDVQTLFVNRDDGGVQEDGSYYDFSGDGQFSIADIQELFVEFTKA